MTTNWRAVSHVISQNLGDTSLLPKDVSHLHRVEGNDLRSSKRKSCCLSLSQESTCLRKSCRWKNYYSGLQSLRTEWLGHFVTIVNNLKPSREKQYCVAEVQVFSLHLCGGSFLEEGFSAPVVIHFHSVVFSVECQVELSKGLWKDSEVMLSKQWNV